MDDIVITTLTNYRRAYISGLEEAREVGDAVDIYANEEVLRTIEAIAKDIGVDFDA